MTNPELNPSPEASNVETPEPLVLGRLLSQRAIINSELFWFSELRGSSDIHHSLTVPTDKIDDSDVWAGRAPIAGDPSEMGRVIHDELERRKQD